MEHGKREPAREEASRKPKKQKRTKRRWFGKFLLGIFTLMVIGICTVVLLAGIFMTYVETTLTPTLQVRAEDYTMNLSSHVYYQDKTTGE